MPSIAFAARLAALRPKLDPGMHASFLGRLGLAGLQSVVPFGSARAALAAYFAELARRDARRIVILSCQICPVVPQLLIEAGFKPFFIDTDIAVPVPSVRQTMEGYDAAGGREHVAAVMFAPFYGHIPPDDDALDRKSFADAAVVVDMAQGLLLADRLPRLFARADAAVYSFGVGKGLDLGGGLLAQRKHSMTAEAPRRIPGAAAFGPLPKILALHAAARLGFYRHILRFVEREVEDGKADLGDLHPRASMPVDALTTRLDAFAGEVVLARTRAAELLSMPAIERLCQHADIYGGAQATHLRQVLRLREPAERDTLVSALRRAGVDATPAGEPLPSEYLLPGSFSAHGDPAWPNASRFKADAIRLPFLGRLDPASFTELKTVLERLFEQRLS